MKSQTTVVLERPRKSKKIQAKSQAQVLAVCPADGAGWCPYPFSVKQLERHLQHLAEEKKNAPKKKRAKQLVR